MYRARSVIEDYSNFSYTLSKNPTKKLWEKLLRRLNTYVNSNKFMRLGSTVDLYDLVTGKRIKRPIYNVLYKKSFLDLKGIPALLLRQKLRTALRERDRKTIKELLLYDTYRASKFVTPKLQQILEDRKRRNRVLFLVAALGGAGSLLGLVPYIKAKKLNNNKKPQMTSLLINSIVGSAAIGAGAGVLTTGLIESLRD